MAVSLALLTGLVWIVLALAGLAWRRRHGRASWDIWDALRGVGALAALRDMPGLLAGPPLLGDGHRLGLEAESRGDGRGALNLARADLASALSLLDALRRDIREYRRRACVVQIGGHLPPLPAHELSPGALRGLAVFESCLSIPLDSAGRLRLRLNVLGIALGLLARRARRLARRADARLIPRLPSLGTDVAALMDAAAASRHALSQGWVVLRAARGTQSAHVDAHHVM